MRSLFFTVVLIVGIFKCQSQPFNPEIFEYNGYINTIFKNGVYISYFSQEKMESPVFSYDSISKEFIFMDTSLKVLYWGSFRPWQLDSLYHNVPPRKFFLTIPKELTHGKSVKFINPVDGKEYFHETSTIKIRFTCFDYLDYKPFENEFGKIESFGFYYPHLTKPEDIKSSNNIYIINYFYK